MLINITIVSTGTHNAPLLLSFSKLDAGIPEKVCLMSRDAQNVLVVSYADLKRCFETTFEEVINSTAEPVVVEELPPPVS